MAHVKHSTESSPKATRNNFNPDIIKKEHGLHFKTAVQKRDLLVGHRPNRNTMWDLLTLKDVLNKKAEDEVLREKQHGEKIRLREFYLDQIRDQESVRKT